MIPPRLVELVAEKRLVPFIGAGFSVPSGLPTWHSLVRGLVRHTATPNQRELLTRIGEVSDLIDVAEVLDSLTPTPYATLEYLRNCIDDPRVRPNPYHSALLDIDADTIITTNWDRLLEQSYESNHGMPHVIYRERDVPFYSPSTRVQVLKLHGTIEDAESLVFRKTDYDRYWAERELLFSLVSILGATRGFVFLGYGFGDPNFLTFLERLKQRAGRTRPEHYALTYGATQLDPYLQRLGVVTVPVPGFEVAKKNYEESTSAVLRELGAGAKSHVTGNVGRAVMVNEEIERIINRRPPLPLLRMRGALGWLSNPVPVAGDPVYGSEQRDAVERRMTELIDSFLNEIAMARVRCILHINAEPLLRQYEPRHLRRRMQEIIRVMRDHPGQIEIAHDDLPSQVNEMLFDESSALLGFRQSDTPGIGRVWLTRNRHVVQDRIRHFDFDFENIREANRSLAVHSGIDVEGPDWSCKLIESLLRDQIKLLEQRELTVRPEPLRGVDCGLPRLATAATYAVLKHSESGQTREDGVTPFGVHPLRVVERLRGAGETSEDLLCAAALHDTVEDCKIEPEVLTQRFGPVVGRLVSEVTQDTAETFANYVSRLDCASREAKAIKLADRLDNVLEMHSFGCSRFGDMPVAEYLAQSQQVLAACCAGNAILATGLADAIAKAVPTNAAGIHDESTYKPISPTT